MSEAYLHIAIAVWWSFGSIVFVGLRKTGNEPAGHCIAIAVFWPFFAALAIPLVLWRIPFKAAKTIQVDLRNRGLLREFNQWLKARNTTND